MTSFEETPITIEEIHVKYGVKLRLHQETSWMRLIEFRDNKGDIYQARLRWDENNGYEIFWADSPPQDLLDMADRPEFEYVLDWYTEDELFFDKSIPNQQGVGLARQEGR
jgi:hypothetical protein